MSELILASASPRRVELLGALRLPFKVIPSQATELHDFSIPVANLCEANAARKARSVAEEHPDAWVLGADTLVTFKDSIYGKPRNRDEAIQMLKELEGKSHEVITGVCLENLSLRKTRLFHVSTSVTFHRLSPADILNYISLVNVMDKAGAYAIQEHGHLIVESINGSYTNVVGLPIERVSEELILLGFPVNEEALGSFPKWHP